MAFGVCQPNIPTCVLLQALKNKNGTMHLKPERIYVTWMVPGTKH